MQVFKKKCGKLHHTNMEDATFSSQRMQSFRSWSYPVKLRINSVHAVFKLSRAINHKVNEV